MLDGVDLPELAGPDATGPDLSGVPHHVRVGGDGARVAFLRAAGPHDPAGALWVHDVATATERLIAEPSRLLSRGGPEGITAFALDRDARIAAFAYAGRLFRADLKAGEVVDVATETPVCDPRPDPTGTRIGYVTVNRRIASLRVVGPDGDDQLLAGEAGGPAGWGVPEPVAVDDFGRTRGWWWSPDGRSVLAARHTPAGLSAGVATPPAGGINARVSLHLLHLDGGWVDVHWDRETYPYLVDVHFGAGGGPLITVLRRSQQHGLVLAVDQRTGESQVHAELADARWVEPVPGTPRHLPDGRVLVGGELAHDGFDARCLFADGSLLTPAGLYVRRVVGVLPSTGTPAVADLVVEGSDGDPSEQHVFRVRTATGGVDARRITSTPGWHVAEIGGDVLVLGSRSPEAAGTRWTVRRGNTDIGTLTSCGDTAPAGVRPQLERVTDRRLPAAVLYPGRQLAGQRLPVLLELGDGPHRQRVTADHDAWQERRWWADAGLAVVSIDTRGTPGVAPSFAKAVHRRLADTALTDLVDALQALTGKHPDLDLSRVAVRGTGLGGWLAALAVLRRPEVFGCAVARDPVTDWTVLSTAFAERYLGRPEDAPAGGEVYAHHSLVTAAAEGAPGPAEAGPILLVQPLTGGAAVPGPTLRFCAALLAAGHPYALLPVTGPPETTDALLAAQELAFVRRHLP
jgi:dipeptidyl-peptidase-4